MISVRLFGRLFSLFGLAFVLALCGCGEDGPPVVPVNGKVMRDGKPLTNVAVSFVPTGSGLAAIGKADSSGNIQLQTNGRPGAMVGTYKVGITEPIREMTPEALASGGPPPVSFDPKFESPNSSGIEYTVAESGGTFEFTVTNKKK